MEREVVLDLGRRLHNAQLFALTSPLITTSSGAKMGKTAAGAVWLNADLVSPYEYWQYWRNTEDADVERFLKLFTVLPLDAVPDFVPLMGFADDASVIAAALALVRTHLNDRHREAARRTLSEEEFG